MKLNFWPFNRNKQSGDSSLPEEVQNYYQAEKRERAGVAGLLAVGTLIVTVVVAMGLFFGGRAIYRAIFDNDDNNTSQVAQSPQDNKPEENTNGQNGATPENNSPAPSAPSPAPNPQAQTPAQTPNTGSDLPNTGSGDILALTIGAIIISATLHYAFAVRAKRIDGSL